MDNKQQGDAATCTHCSAYEQCLPGPSSAQELPRGRKDTDNQQLGPYGGLRRWQKQRGITVATTVWG